MVVPLQGGVEEHDGSAERGADDVDLVGAGARALQREGDGGAEIGDGEVFEAERLAPADGDALALGPQIDAPDLESGAGQVAFQRLPVGVIAEDEGVHAVAGDDQHRPASGDQPLFVPGLEEREVPAVLVGDEMLEGLHAACEGV